MVRCSFSNVLLILAVGLGVGGCAHWPSREPAAAKPPVIPTDLPPPQPGPALFIPGSVRQANAIEEDEAAPPQKAVQEAVPAPPVSQPPATVANSPPPMPLPPLLLVAASTTAQVEPADSQPHEVFRHLLRKAMARHQTMDSYTLRLRRREAANGQTGPDETILMKFRLKPWSIAFKWLGEHAKGREVLFVKDGPDSQIHIRTATGDIPFLPAGKHMKFSPDSILVKSRSRYPITESGIDGALERFRRLVEGMEKGDAKQGTVRYLGLQKRPEYECKLEVVQHVLPPNVDPNLPRGGQRQWFFDTVWNLPLLLIAFDEAGREVEYYCHDRLQFPVGLDDDDFNPEKLWK